MLKIQSIGNAIRTRFAKGREFATSSLGHLSTDIFDRQTTTIKNVGDYLRDVVFEKSGSIFPTIKATFKDKQLATTKKDLFKQLANLNLSNDSERITEKKISSNFFKLEKKDCMTMARISKFFHEINQPENKNLAIITRGLYYNKNTLSTINKLLTHPRDFNLEEITEIVSSNAYLKPKYLKILLDSNPNQIKNSSIASCLKSLPLQGEKEKDYINAAQRIREKLSNIDDSKIKDFVESKLIDIPQELKTKLKINPKCVIPKDGAEDFEKCELLLDSYHCENSAYSMLNGETQEYYKTIKKATPELANKISTELGANIQKLKDSHKRLLETTDAGIFNEAVRLEPVKQFIGIYAEEEPEMANYLYGKYFLSKMGDCELKNKCIEIEKELGTKVFVDINTQPSMLNKIKRELVEWKNTGKRKAQLPLIFDFSKMKQNFIEKSDTSIDAYARRKDHSINAPADSFYDEPYQVLRHEMTHLNDTEFFQDKGIINGIDFDNIQKNSSYLEELKAAGIKDYGLKYAYKNKKEFIAVASEGDTREYSDEFKKVLIKLGFPEWTFNLKQLNPPMKITKALQDSFINKAMDRLLKKEQNITFPNGIMLTGNKVDLKEVAEWLAEKSCFVYQKIDFNELTQEDALRQLKIIADVMKEGDSRALIQIDNFKRFTTTEEENDKFISKLKFFLGKCADEYNCTVIAGVDDASKIDPYLMTTHRFQMKLDADGNSI